VVLSVSAFKNYVKSNLSIVVHNVLEKLSQQQHTVVDVIVSP
jgi:hypothetical protein